MDTKVYFRQLREKAAEIEKEFVVVKSLTSEDGGKAGVLNEVSREMAAKLIVDDKAELATPEETATFYAEQKAASDKAREDQRISKLQLAVISDAEIDRLRKSMK